MSKFTPGKWVAVGAWVEHESDDVADICSCDPVSVGQSHLLRTYEESVANARLIACAPELYETLMEARSDVESILEMTERGGHRNEPQRAFLDRIDDLLNRAGRV